MSAPLPYAPAQYTPADIAAVQALERGEANAEQQMRALRWILLDACQVNEVDYRTESRDHAYASGRRFPGQQIQKLLVLNAGTFRKNQNI